MIKSVYKGLLGACLLILCTAIVRAEGVGSANVKFGRPTNNQSECEGKGVCMLTSIGTQSGEVPVKFTLTEDPTSGFYTLTMQFNISLMSSADHDYLYRYFLYSDGEPRPLFAFDGDYTFTNKDLCRSLGIDVGTLTITPESVSGPRNIEKIKDSEIRLTYVMPMPGKK
ncbi:MAG: hypothetical protein H6550_00850 [Chitinophagales bacterium]|nr:hypothetical protein [Chitinophagales bacterium]